VASKPEIDEIDALRAAAEYGLAVPAFLLGKRPTRIRYACGGRAMRPILARAHIETRGGGRRGR